MAKLSGAKAAVYFGGDASEGTKVPGVISFSLPERGRIDVTTAGDDTEKFLLGLKAGAIQVQCLYDASEADLETAIANGSALSDINFYADEAGSPVLTLASAYVVESIDTSGPANQAVRRTLTFLAA
jgi:hypothetical protein